MMYYNLLLQLSVGESVAKWMRQQGILHEALADVSVAALCLGKRGNELSAALPLCAHTPRCSAPL